jgi:hypothetical protein
MTKGRPELPGIVVAEQPSFFINPAMKKRVLYQQLLLLEVPSPPLSSRPEKSWPSARPS